MPASELGVLLALVDRALESQIEALGARPQAWRALADAFALGRALDDGRETRAALIEVHRLLFANGHRPVQARDAWLDAVVSAAAARAIAASQRGSPSTAALAAVVSHGAEGIALRAIAAVESNHGLQVDSATLATLVATLAPLAAAGIARKWKLAAALEAAARDARRVHEQHSSSIEVKAVYFGRLLAATRPGRGLVAPGLEYEILHGSGLGVRDLDEVRATVAAAERVALALARDLCSPAGLEAAG
jgi:hypothetical protein